MSWTELVSAERAELRPSPYDVARFGLAVDRLLVPTGADTTVAAVAGLVGDSGADVVVLRYPAERTEWFAALRRTGRDLLAADTLCYWRLATGTGRRPVRDDGLTVTDGSDLGPQEVSGLVGSIFAGYGSHYTANPLFDPDAALAGYQEWARRSLGEGDALLLRRAGRPVAVATLDTQPDAVEILLAGVLPQEQGQGRYAHLLAGVEDFAERAGRRHVVISTQGHNVNVQRAWARYGFEPVATFLTVHLVRPGLLPA